MQTLKITTLRSALVLTAWILGVIVALPAVAQDVPDDPLTFRRTLMAWLECEECTNGELEATLELGEAVVPSLGAALELGPSPASLELVRRHLVTTYQDLQAYATTHPEAAVPLSEKDFVAIYLENYVATYQVRAARALGELGGLRAEEHLWRGLAATTREDVTTAIREALAKR